MHRESLKEALERHTAPMALSRQEGSGKVRCLACGHRCVIPDGHVGVCKVRFNRGGVLHGPWGYVAGLQDDPIEKKPFHHVLPGARALSFGMLGCDFHCPFCHNWVTSQALRDADAMAPFQPLRAEQIVRRAGEVGALILTSTYNEPLITSEWAAEVFRLGKARGFVTSYVSNGNNTEEVIAYLRPYLDLCNIDLKSFHDGNYRKLGGTLQGVLDGIQRVHRAGIWMELVTLVVPGFNDSDAELREMAAFIAGMSPDIPWHVTAFYPNYRLRDRGATPVAGILRACEIGREAGLRYVYPGNLPRRGDERENTLCPQCGTVLVQRDGYSLRGYHLQGNRCPRCQTQIPGVWHTPQTLKKTHHATDSSPRPVWL